ncbi:MAG: hypothetical protein WBD67_08790 [Terracidiphilus sp.]
MTTDEIRAVGIVVWLISPGSFLLIEAWNQWRSKWNLRSRRTLVAAVAALNWIGFAVLLIRAQTPYGMIFQTSILTMALLVMACVGLVLSAKHWRLLLANAALVSLWVLVAYGQAHWMVSHGTGDVRINGRPANARIYIAYPTDSENEAVVMAEIQGAGEYFLSFDTGDVSRATRYAVLPLPDGVWTVPSLRQLKWTAALHPLKDNQFRFAAPDGRVVEVQF